ncbi:hypothetical protein JCM8547_008997 [Rhodosporidiobolus lusitaniae]
MSAYEGGCFCGAVRYKIELEMPKEEARSSMCHCGNCKRFTGGPYGITIRVPISFLTYTAGTDPSGSCASPDSLLKTHVGLNGVTRWFCRTCGSGIAEVGKDAKDKQRYVFAGTLDDPEADIAKPKGEFFTKHRASWLAPVEGTFQKKEIKE